MAQTLKQAIKALQKYADSKGATYINVRHGWVSVYNDNHKGSFMFSAYMHGYTWVDSETIGGLIEQFEKLRADPPMITALGADDLIL